MTSTREEIDPVHPGEVFYKEFLEPNDISIEQAAKDMMIGKERLLNFIQGYESVRPYFSLWLARYTRTSELYWLNLQARFDLDRLNMVFNAKILDHIKPIPNDGDIQRSKSANQE